MKIFLERTVKNSQEVKPSRSGNKGPELTLGKMCGRVHVYCFMCNVRFMKSLTIKVLTFKCWIFFCKWGVR